MRPVKQSIRYLVLAWIGRQLYNFREWLEGLQYWVDEKAGRFWKEW